jgi:hypothetical protein
MKKTKTQTHVERILMEFPDTRHHLDFLYALVWKRESKAKTVTEFLAELKSSKLSHPATINRWRQRILSSTGIKFKQRKDSKPLKYDMKKILEQFPEYRDNDLALIADIWANDLKKLGYSIDLQTFFNMLELGNLTNPETIRRTRQKLQQRYPELRGANYNVRQQIKTEEYKSELGYKSARVEYN